MRITSWVTRDDMFLSFNGCQQFCCFSGLAFYIHLSLQNRNTWEFPLIKLLFSRLPASVRCKRSKRKVKEIWARNLLYLRQVAWNWQPTS